MIYLIDDNQNKQREQLGITFVAEATCNGFLTSIEKLEKHEKADDISHLEFLKDAKCILLHSTTEDWDSEKGFLKASTSNATKIKDYITDFGDKIPLVLFSNKESQSTETIFQPDKNPNFINMIRKNDFYKNLRDFVEDYAKSDRIELRILMWGKNFKAKEIDSISVVLLHAMMSKSGKEKLLLSDLSSIQHDFKKFVNLAFPGQDSQWFFDSLEDYSITISDFRDKISLITESFLKYGKNIFTW